MRFAKHTLMVACSALALAAAVQAGDKEDQLIDKVVSAYGGDALTGLDRLRINDYYKILSVGQSANAEVMDIGINNVSLTIDFENKRKSITNWNKNRGGGFLNQTIFDGEHGHAINHITKTVSENGNLNYATVGGGIMRTNDVTLARLLSEARDNAQHGGETTYRGRPHEKITFKMEGSPDLTLFVDQGSHMISKMTRQNPQLGELSYIFSDYRTENGVSYAADSNFLIAGQPNIVTTSRTIDVNPEVAKDFALPSGYTDQGGNLDTSEMSVRELADGVYYAGQGNGFSIFVDAGDHFVASGGYPALPARFEAVKAFAKVDKPLKQQIVTHHHSDHLGGMNEAAELGADFVTVAGHVGPVRGQVQGEVGDDRFVLVDGKASLAGGKVQVFDIATAHSDQYLLVYVPSAKLVFSADHFSTALEEGLPSANNNMVTFRQAVEKLDLDIDGFLGAHGPRMLTMADLRSATDGYQEASCPAGASVCSQ